MKIALLGRPNVGKSTLFNRLAYTSKALVDPTPGLTRDRKIARGHLAGLEFEIIDTPGLESPCDTSLKKEMWRQSTEAAKQSDVLLFIIDNFRGISSVEEEHATWIRRLNKPVILVANKCDGKISESIKNDAFTLGFGEPIFISAMHGQGLIELYQALERHQPSRDLSNVKESSVLEEEVPIQLAIVGRPNVGKSTLVNAILKQNRVLTHEEAGSTRDSISIDFTYQHKKIRLIDTAGLRKKARVEEGPEKLSVSETIRVIQFAQIVILVIDATMPLERQDLTIANQVVKEGRCIVIAVNKMDQISNRQAWLEELQYQVGKVLSDIKGVMFCPISATKRAGVETLLEKVLSAFEIWNQRVPTGQLNRWFESVIHEHTPPLIKGRRLKLKYLTQTKTRPPTFILFTNFPQDFPPAYERYIINNLRASFDLQGVPIRLLKRSAKNPYHTKES